MFICKRNKGHVNNNNNNNNHHGPDGGSGGGGSSSSSGGLLSFENLNYMMMNMPSMMSPRSVLEHRALSGLAVALPPPPPPPLSPPGGPDDRNLRQKASSIVIYNCSCSKQQPPPLAKYYWAPSLGPDSVVSSARAVDTGCLRMSATQPPHGDKAEPIKKAATAAAAATTGPLAANSASVVDGSDAAAAARGVVEDGTGAAVAPMSIPILRNADHPSLASRSLPERHPHWHSWYEMDHHQSTCSSSDESIFHSSPPSTNFYNPEFSVADDFLSRCYYCHSRLGPGKDIYMYRGDRAFCSAECRYEQIVVDEHKEAHY